MSDIKTRLGIAIKILEDDRRVILCGVLEDALEHIEYLEANLDRAENHLVIGRVDFP